MTGAETDRGKVVISQGQIV